MVARLEDDRIDDGLNPAQLDAVTHPQGPLLVVAGAGSGKTRVLTRRIAHLIGERGVSPFGILAITFTNKAAGEMKERVARLVGDIAHRMWVSTFHSACVRILRRDAERIGYPSRFSIYDQGDSTRLVGHVAVDRRPADGGRHLGGALRVAVRNHDPPRPLGVESLGQRPPDAAGTTRDDHDLPGEFHAPILWRPGAVGPARAPA
jgi:hypothetical protein